MLDPLEQIFNRLAGWVNSGSKGIMDQTVRGLASRYRKQIEEGRNAEGSGLAPLAESTLKGPVRREGNQTIRETLGDTPLYASGNTASSIQATKTGSDEWTIAPSTDQGRKILESNARTSHNGNAFYGDTRKPVRDPLSVEDPQLDFIEDEIFKDLDNLLRVI